MAEENRRISTTPIPVPVLFGGSQSAAPTPSPLSQAPVAAAGEGDAPAAPTDAPAPAEAPAEAAVTEPDGGDAATVPVGGDAPTEAPTEAPAEATTADVTMTDAGSADKAASPTPAPVPTTTTTTSVASPAPARTSTPLRTNGHEASSRAASQHPDPGFTMPPEAPPHGAPTRQYLNSKVTGALLDGMKLIAKERPNDPLRVLGEYLLQRSKMTEHSQ